MLLAENVSFYYNSESPLLSNVYFQLHPGETIGLAGPSGCGKSTLGKLLAGFHTPLDGTISCNGEPLPSRGYCPVQLIFQHPEFAVNPRWRIGRILQEGNPDFPDFLSRFNVDNGWLDKYPHELSGGELQRITLIRAMNRRTRYLIADEMTASLDPGTQALIWQTVLPWAKSQNVGILAISHDQHLLKRISSRLVDSFSWLLN